MKLRPSGDQPPGGPEDQARAVKHQLILAPDQIAIRHGQPVGLGSQGAQRLSSRQLAGMIGTRGEVHQEPASRLGHDARRRLLPQILADREAHPHPL